MAFPVRAKFTTSRKPGKFRLSPETIRYGLIIAALIVLFLNIFGLYPQADFDAVSYTLAYAILGGVVYFTVKFRAQAGLKWERRIYYLLFLVFMTLANVSGGIDSPLKWGAFISSAMLLIGGGFIHMPVMACVLFFAFIKKAQFFTGADFALFAVFTALPLIVMTAAGIKRKGEVKPDKPAVETDRAAESSDFGVIAHDLLAKLLKAYRPLLGAGTLVFLMKKEGGPYEFKMMLSDSTPEAPVDTLYETDGSGDIIMTAVKKGGFFLFDTAALQMPYHKTKVKTASAAVYPVMTGKMLGVIAADFERHPEDKELLGARMKNLSSEIVDILSLFEINNRVLDREKRVSILYDIYGRLNLVEGREKMLSEFFGAVREFDIYSGYIAYYDQAERAFRAGESFNYPKTVQNLKVKVSDDEILKYIMQGEGSTVVKDTARRNLALNYRRANIDSFFISALKSGNNVYGFIKLDKEKGYSFSDFEVKTLKMLLSRVVSLLENSDLYEKIHRQATEDGLTGLCNHLTFQERLRVACETRQQCVSLALTDIDHFKKFNDAFGHQEGDNVLKNVAAMLKKFTSENPGTFAARYGGEEFVVVFENHDINRAVAIADKIRKYSEENLKGGNASETRPITMSIGVSSCPDYSDSPRSLIKNADEALYLAKQEGRNRVKTVLDVRNTDRRKTEG